MNKDFLRLYDLLTTKLSLGRKGHITYRGGVNSIEIMMYSYKALSQM